MSSVPRAPRSSEAWGSGSVGGVGDGAGASNAGPADTGPAVRPKVGSLWGVGDGGGASNAGPADTGPAVRPKVGSLGGVGGGAGDGAGGSNAGPADTGPAARPKVGVVGGGGGASNAGPRARRKVGVVGGGGGASNAGPRARRKVGVVGGGAEQVPGVGCCAGGPELNRPPNRPSRPALLVRCSTEPCPPVSSASWEASRSRSSSLRSAARRGPRIGCRLLLELSFGDQPLENVVNPRHRPSLPARAAATTRAIRRTPPGAGHRSQPMRSCPRLGRHRPS